MTPQVQEFYDSARICIDEFLATTPITATFICDHRFDANLDDYTEEGLERRREWARRWQRKYESYDSAAWPVDAQVDLAVMIRVTQRILRNLDKVRLEYKSPLYPSELAGNSIGLILQRNYAPLEERIGDILSRLRGIPKLLSDARGVIVPSEVPAFWAQVAVRSARGWAARFSGPWLVLADSAPDLADDLTDGFRKSAAAFEEYAVWVENEVLPRAGGTPAVGHELYDEILREEHLLDDDTDTLRARILEVYEDLERQLAQTARAIDPRKSARELMEEAEKQDGNRPTPASLLDDYRQEIAKARRFTVDHDMLTLPAGESVRVEATPELLKPQVAYGGIIIRNFSGDLREIAYHITEVDESETAEKMGWHAYTNMSVNVIHEIYPGHHSQLAATIASKNLPRLFARFLSASTFGGWVYHAVRQADDLGYFENPVERLSYLQVELEGCALGYLDCSLHGAGASLEEMQQFLGERTGFSPDSVRFQILTALQFPGEGQAWYMGYVQMREIISEYRKEHPRASIREVNDAVLRCGLVPPRLMRRLLFAPAPTPAL